MRTALFAIASLILGGIVGGVLARQEFAYETLPIATGGAGSGTPAPADQKGPRLTVLSAERFDFGEMDQNAEMEHTFTIRNDGDEPLSVTQEGTSSEFTYRLALERKT